MEVMVFKAHLLHQRTVGQALVVLHQQDIFLAAVEAGKIQDLVEPLGLGVLVEAGLEEQAHL
jgi:hypothetical protein